MKLMRTATLAAAAVSMLAFSVEQASAQPPYTPTLSVTVNGNNATIQWTRVNEAEGYTVQAGYAPGAPLLSQNVPASITGGVLKGVPNGVYYLRVRAYAGPDVGPWSNEVVAVVPGVVCTPPAAPTAGAEVNGATVTIGWSPVAGAQGYYVQYSRYSGGTELQQLVLNGTSHSQHVPWPGTYFARVVAGNACGQLTTGNEVAFTITNIVGPRTPDPPPGQMLPLPGYGASVVASVAAAYPHDLANSCVEAGGNNRWLFRVVQALRQHDSRWGLNWKRMVVGDMSQDYVTYNFGAGPDEGTTNVYAIDVIASHCGNPSWSWLDETDPNGAGAKWTLQPYLAAGFPGDER
jgi:hypothetical protein